MENQNVVERETAKQAYVTPELVRYGTVEELTKAQPTPTVMIDGASLVI